jgi:1-acyl-sn-glycerol-3-phosphate acyltransferase
MPKGLYPSHYAGSGVFSELFQAYVWAYSRPRVHGLEHLPETGAWLLVANHSSHADTAVLYAAVPRRMRGRLLAAAAQDYFFTGGLRQTMVRALFNGVPVERAGQSNRDPLRHVIRALREGYGVLLFPEGTRSVNGEIGRFRSGIGRLIALFPGVPVVPAYLEGTADMMPKGRFIPVPGRVTITFGAPLFLAADANDPLSWRAAAEQVREAVLALSLPPATDVADTVALTTEPEVAPEPPAETPLAPEPPPEPERLRERIGRALRSLRAVRDEPTA